MPLMEIPHTLRVVLTRQVVGDGDPLLFHHPRGKFVALPEPAQVGKWKAWRRGDGRQEVMKVYWFERENLPLSLNLLAAVEESYARFQLVLVLIYVQPCLYQTPPVSYRFGATDVNVGRHELVDDGPGAGMVFLGASNELIDIAIEPALPALAWRPARLPS